MRGSKTSTPYDHRMQVNFHSGDTYEASAEEREFWEELSACFLDGDWFVELVRSKFPHYFDIRFGEFFRPENYTDFKRQPNGCRSCLVLSLVGVILHH